MGMIIRRLGGGILNQDVIVQGDGRFIVDVDVGVVDMFLEVKLVEYDGLWVLRGHVTVPPLVLLAVVSPTPTPAPRRATAARPPTTRHVPVPLVLLVLAALP